MPRPVDRDAKRLKILEAASLRFAELGYDAASMDAVALAAGVSKGSLYDYFESKEDLFYAVFEWFEGEVMRESLSRMRDAADARARLINFADASVGALMEKAALYPVTLEVWAAAAKRDTRARFADAMRNLYAMFRAQVAGLIQAAQAGGEVRAEVDAMAIAGVMTGAVDGLMLQYWLDPSFDPRVWVREFVAALFDGVAVKGG